MPVSDILAMIERKYGAKSAVVRNLNTLIEENATMERMSTKNKKRPSKIGGLLAKLLSTDS